VVLRNYTICPTKINDNLPYGNMCEFNYIFKNHIIRNNSYVFMQCSLLVKHFHYHVCLGDTMVTKINKMATIKSLLDKPAEKMSNGILWVTNTSSNHW